MPARFEFTVPQLAAAALAIMLLSGGSVWLALRKPSSVVPSGPVASAPDRTPAAGSPSSPSRTRLPATPPNGVPDAAVAAFDETRYDAAVAELERVLREHGSELDTTTVRILQQNLEIIDRAIEQARRALLADPANPYLNGHLAAQMKLKIRLLQRATEVVAAHG
jgi:hypothetical protein